VQHNLTVDVYVNHWQLSFPGLEWSTAARHVTSHIRMYIFTLQILLSMTISLSSVADPGGGHRAMPPPIIKNFFSKVRFLMSFQVFLDLIIDLSNETITFIN